ncbi:TetR/AcrR family transcriptional regulator [Lutimaribacter sp. EGI FJ00015]|uniref:TetR/AcrR family transcriptional regulator n=1 Tax=Lutimaribacter degradans TaxID=2945989 RepID=A0ACC5ZRR0_9RHOB|nr:TetR/AcrR family transcriptional regulator [Lutimaribacter sp. EGI FJ00013]MCM2560820.1 TetR/AcrR family transcriptional regulator [Lutimaribacter sp. EGI FJ00013]MCO0612235.1 TetR/AcrR family transcriptional regulator [Lutimaribacter sp. EGI FJ00015]MCO0634645.1 TetR/AcrR family transcriptional regulator [Lutimaribacter sp. EGI FJ00014]
MTRATPPDPLTDPRQQAILGAAFEAFRNYGFRRTSMDDIARGAGMSRAALYLHFRNKEDIFRSLAAHYYDTAEQSVRAELRPGRDVAEALPAAFAAQAGELFEALLTSPHGEELLDTKYAQAADVAEAGEARLAAIHAAWLEAEAEAGRVDLAPFGDDAQALSETMLTALHGLKAGRPDPGTYRASAERLARLFGRALAVGN